MSDLLLSSPVVDLIRLWPTLDRQERLALLNVVFSHWHPVRVWLFRRLAPRIIGAR